MDILLAFYVSFVVNVVVVALLAMVFFMGGPVGTFIKARLRRQIILFIANKDRYLDIVVGKSRGGLVETRKYGDYSIIPKTTFIIGNGCRAGICYEPFGSTLPSDFVRHAEVLQDAGIRTIDELGAAEKVIAECRKELDAMTPEELNKHRAELEEMGRVTEAIDSVRNFFAYDFNPNTIRATINRAVADIISEYKKFDVFKWVFAFGMIVFFGALAYLMISSGVGNAVAGAAQNIPVGAGIR